VTASQSQAVNGGPRRGFSLIEVLLAMAILMMSLVAITQLVGIGSDNGLNARFSMRGTRLAESKMAEIESGALALDSASQGGQFEGDDSAWSWSCDVQPGSAPNLYQVTVTVTRDFRGAPFEVSLGRLMIDPMMMGSAAQAERPAESEADDPLGMGGTTP
jgi:general secretion pathway protein I